MLMGISIIAIAVGIACIAINQIITNVTVKKLQQRQQQLQQQLTQIQTKQSE